ncbi:LytR/AlgR family response regulator transcription factor [Agathobaculum sp.]|uniref:LytR/AlgR family response regulator transcription factor n=1 Tax=Agathobaculum sp. TaxID=2048138 RepID=UPI002A816686|nr:response regulator [Agathobaculum sp.]MDY3617520.1 response regulator [Agathobaculum sp.]
MRVAICDNTPDDAADIAAMVKEYASVHPDIALAVSVFSESAALLEEIEQAGSGYDLYLLDILLSGQGGIELARTLRRRNDKGRIVFATKSPDCALPAFSVKASDYLLKPVTRQALFSVLEDTSESLAHRPLVRRQISFRTPGGLQTVLLEDVVYVEVRGHMPAANCASILRHAAARPQDLPPFGRSERARLRYAVHC